MLFTTSKPNPRGLDATILADKARANGLTGAVYNSITAFTKKALET
jgi:dihydrofolate synthase/folylpolyglutamate synthase